MLTDAYIHPEEYTLTFSLITGWTLAKIGEDSALSISREDAEFLLSVWQGDHLRDFSLQDLKN